MAVKKILTPKKKRQRYVAERNVAKLKESGWSVAKVTKDKHGRVLGVRTNTSDLTLMEK